MHTWGFLLWILKALQILSVFIGGSKLTHPYIKIYIYTTLILQLMVCNEQIILTFRDMVNSFLTSSSHPLKISNIDLAHAIYLCLCSWGIGLYRYFYQYFVSFLTAIGSRVWGKRPSWLGISYLAFPLYLV